MSYFKLNESKIFEVSGDFECVGVWGGEIFVKGKNLREPWVKAELPSALVEKDNELLAQAKERLERTLEAKFEAHLNALNPIESATYEIQATEAKELLKSKNASAPTLRALAAERECDVLELARKVLEKNESYKQKLGELLGKKQALAKRIESANSQDELSALLDEIDNF